MQKRTKIILASATAGIIGLAAIGAAVADSKHSGRGWGHGSGHGAGMHSGMGGGMHSGSMHGMMGDGMRGRGRGHGMGLRIKKFAKRYDANKDGEITQSEIDTNRTDWHKKFDTDGNGKLSLKEFESLWLQAKRRRMVRSFQRFDEDGDATVTLDEYTSPLSKVVERMDRNGDGVLSRKDRHHRKNKRHMREMHEMMMKKKNSDRMEESGESTDQ